MSNVVGILPLINEKPINNAKNKYSDKCLKRNGCSAHSLLQLISYDDQSFDIYPG